MYLDTLDIIKEHKVEDPLFVKNQSINFCKQQTLKKAIKEVEVILNNGYFDDFQNVEKIIQGALQVGVTTNEIVNALDDPEKSLRC